MWRLRHGGERWAIWPTLAFLVLGLGSIGLVTMSCLGVYDRELFWPRAVQYTTLLGVSPLFLAVGEPVELVRRCLSGTGRRRLAAALRNKAVRIAAFPLLGAVVGATSLLVIYLTPLYRLTLTSELAHHLVWLELLLVGSAFFVPEVDQGEDLLPAWCGYSARVAISLVDGLLDAIPGVVVMTMNGTIAAGFYNSLHRRWGPSPHWDQTIGGALMLTISEIIALPFLLVLVTRWMREDERRTREADRRLDEQAYPGTDADASIDRTVAPPLSDRPWWETDPGPLAQRETFRRHPDH